MSGANSHTTSEYRCAKPACGALFTAKVADRKRGWAKCCSKACAAWVREKKLDRGGYRLTQNERNRRDADVGLVFGGYDPHFDKHGVIE